MSTTEITERNLKEMFPNGHPGFVPLLLQLMGLHDKKNFDYANGGDPLGNFDRVAKLFESYPKLKLSNQIVVALTYAFKQLDAILWALNTDYTPRVEGLSERAKDIVVYSAIVCLMLKDMEKAATHITISPPVPERQSGLVEKENDERGRETGGVAPEECGAASDEGQRLAQRL